MKLRLLIILTLICCYDLCAQDRTPQKLKVFIDCSNTFCDFRFIRSEIDVVDFLLDRVASDVHVLVTSQQNGSGGDHYQMIFYGQNSFKQARDTLRFVTDPNATDFERREKLLKYLKAGLVPLVAKTNLAESMSITMKTEESLDSLHVSHETKDKWNYWIVRIGGNGNINMDQVYKSSEIRGNFRLSRTTDDWKVDFGLFGGLEKSSYEYETDQGALGVMVKNTNYRFENTVVRSLNDHWSYGYQLSFLNDTFTNYKSSSTFLPQLEYSFFPYKDVNNRFVTIRYGMGPQYNHYYQATVFDKKEEMLWGHNVELNISFNQKWGLVNTGLRYRNYFHDWKINNLGLATEMEVRVTGGLFFYVYLSGGLVHDQIYLPRQGATGEEVLSRMRELQSSYNFETFFGVNYRFGSKLNNFVNPRFTSTFDDF